MNCRGGMDSWGVARRLVEKFDGLRPGKIGVLAAQHSRGYSGEILGDDDRRGLGGLRGGVVLGVSHEGELAWASVFDAGHAGDFGVAGGVVEAGVEGGGDVSEFHGGVSGEL